MRTLFAAAALSLTPGVLVAQHLIRHEFSESHMGTTFRVVLYAEEDSVARTAAESAFRLIGRLDSLFSDYRSDSEVARLANSAGTRTPVSISLELWTLLRIAQGWSARTDGAFDVTIGPLTRLWRWAARRGELPDSARLAAARSAVGSSSLQLDSSSPRARLLQPEMALDLGGIAKGFAADAALTELGRCGILAAMVDAGGDLALGAPPPGEAGWRIALPQIDGETLVLARVGVATSGDQYRHVEIGGIRYSHLVDPRTGLGVPGAPVVVAVARDATTADVLASTLGLLTPERGSALLRTVPGAAARVLGALGYQTHNFPETTRSER